MGEKLKILNSLFSKNRPFRQDMELHGIAVMVRTGFIIDTQELRELGYKEKISYPSPLVGFAVAEKRELRKIVVFFEEIVEQTNSGNIPGDIKWVQRNEIAMQLFADGKGKTPKKKK